ncbi:hypothetical protein ACFOMD_08780 [Sphingoaurantiacus capsulatus]|uniref:Uncharacterized protein n=1 Tax=Sphingoaurantiacus capsulatus TaxID=1771310 RepID=A0ABV7XBN8_9SPHN
MLRLILALVVLAGLAFLAQATGLVAFGTSGALRAPSVDLRVDGGEVPKVQVEAAKVKVGVTEKTVELLNVDVGMREKAVAIPKVELNKATTDDGSATR